MAIYGDTAGTTLSGKQKGTNQPSSALIIKTMSSLATRFSLSIKQEAATTY